MPVQVAPPSVENWNAAEIALAGEIAVMKCSCDDGVNVDGLPVIPDQSTEGVAHWPSLRMNVVVLPAGWEYVYPPQTNAFSQRTPGLPSNERPQTAGFPALPNPVTPALMKAEMLGETP